MVPALALGMALVVDTTKLSFRSYRVIYSYKCIISDAFVSLFTEKSFI
jgi:hypothetical protein